MDATNNIAEFQRLNESITMCIDAVRRLVPQLAQVHQSVAQLTLPFHGQGIGAGGYPVGQQAPWMTGFGTPWGQPHVGGIQFGQPGYGPQVPVFVQPNIGPWQTPFGQPTFAQPGPFGQPGAYAAGPHAYAPGPQAFATTPFGFNGTFAPRV